MNPIHFKLKRKQELKNQTKGPIILKGWPKFFVMLFIITFALQMIMLIILNWNI